MKGKIRDRHRNDPNMTNSFNIKWNEDVYLKSERRHKLCTLKDLHFNEDYLIKQKREKKKADIAIKNNELMLPNHYDNLLKKKNECFAIQNGNTMRYVVRKNNTHGCLPLINMSSFSTEAKKYVILYSEREKTSFSHKSDRVFS
ncbi:hypothetical protein AK88_03150 [Plasmodium fragile]|uniref:Uncharacterized protein n=1 Tax=Plasmodium fragile TaxID=5857 RepID=A0A0D9QJV7_PLAFR|nr:uncharacterized protein AK88_03150 [Plasmodium fragile]KJP87233.1 hypothetical protein AK88_03150 [Plasmodium fragile]